MESGTGKVDLEFGWWDWDVGNGRTTRWKQRVLVECRVEWTDGELAGDLAGCVLGGQQSKFLCASTGHPCVPFGSKGGSYSLVFFFFGEREEDVFLIPKRFGSAP